MCGGIIELHPVYAGSLPPPTAFIPRFIRVSIDCNTTSFCSSMGLQTVEQRHVQPHTRKRNSEQMKDHHCSRTPSFINWPPNHHCMHASFSFLPSCLPSFPQNEEGRFPPPWMFNLEGSKGVPLKGDPSASHAFSSRLWVFSSSLVGRPFLFWFWSKRILRIAPCVSPSYSSIFFVESTFVKSIAGPPSTREGHQPSFILSKFSTTRHPSSRFQTASDALMAAWKVPSKRSCPFTRIWRLLDLMVTFTSAPLQRGT
mmetsp:Transcript_55125/g.107817  ORF Transcript_55125/g.107817 Transcript_55125/m.107817 type:complete len:256 (+) Transcript_55125:132-899(+)